jgi:hypothetical protein
MTTTRVLFLALASASLSVGCGTHPVSTAIFSSAGNAQSETKEGLTIEVEVVRDKAKLTELFGTSDLGADVVAVHVLVSDTGSAKGFIVEPKSFRLASGTLSVIAVNGDAGQTLAVMGAIPLSMPIMITGLSMQANSTVIRNNLLRREFKAATLQGDSAEGFLFFKVPQAQKSPSLMLVTATEAGTEVQVQYRFDLNR